MDLTTLDGAIAAYVENLDYSTTESVSKGQAFVAACRALILHQPKEGAMGGGRGAWSPELIAGELNKAEAWLASRPSATGSGGGSVQHFDFSRYRD